MVTNDPLSVYEDNLRCLLARLRGDRSLYQDVLVYEQRLTENINHTRRYGDTDKRKADRAEIIDRLNDLSLSIWNTPFTELCSAPDTVPFQSPAETLQMNEPPEEITWMWTMRIGVFLVAIASVFWLIFQPGFEPLITTITSILGIAAYLVLQRSRYQQYLDRLLALFLAIFVPILITLFIFRGQPFESDPREGTEAYPVSPTVLITPPPPPPIDQLDTSLLFNLAIADASQLKEIVQKNSYLERVLHAAVPVLSLAVHDEVLAAGYADGGIILWDWETGQSLAELRSSASKTDVRSLAFSPDGQMLAAGTVEGTIFFWDVSNRQLISFSSQAHSGIVFSVTFSPDGSTLVSGGADGVIIFWNAGDIHQRASITQAHVAPVWQLAFHLDGEWVASAGEDGQVILWNAATQERVQQWSQGYGVKTLLFSTDGTRLIAGNNHGQIHIYEVNDDGPGIPLADQEAAITGMAISPDGQMLAAGSCMARDEDGFCRQGGVRLWPIGTGQSNYSTVFSTMLKGEVGDTLFTPDGKSLVATSPGGGIPIWSLETFPPPPNDDWAAWEARACQMANRNLTEAEWQTYLPEAPYRLLCAGLPIMPSLVTSLGKGLLLLAKDEQVEMKAKGAEDFVPASPGTNLLAGDELRLEPSMVAWLLCEDMTVFKVPVGIYPIGAHCVSPRDDVNLLIDWQGEVKVKRANWMDFRPASPDVMVLHRGDMISVSIGGHAQLMCENRDKQEMPAGTTLDVRDICPKGVARLGNLADSSRGTRGDTDPLIPYIISPRMTHLLTRQPTLRWHETPDATMYTVRIVGLDWETETSETYVNGADIPLLQEREVYLLIVETDNNRSSREEGVPGLGFLLLPEAETRIVQKAQTDIIALDLPPESEALALAHLYIEYDLITEAIERLSVVVDAGTQTAAVYHLLGALYRQIGLPLMAEAQYLQAISLAQNGNEIDGLALYQAELGEIYLDLGDKVEAVRWLEEARQNYEILGDAQQVEALAKQIENLE